ncbi:MAG: radical SAM protein [Methanomassiliicoccales archaeon]|nr:radical SAM protein [Methanomassiliicoccales archaeon]
MILPDLFSYSEKGAVAEGSNPERGINTREVSCHTALSSSRLPGLAYALNPYEGCEHGCIYCYAPYVLKASPSLWGKWVNARMNIPVLLRKELKTKTGMIGIGTVTDPYQPVERIFSLTRKCLTEIIRKDAPTSILTKSDLVIRDVSLLSKLSRVEIGITVTTLDDRIAAKFEPQATAPSRRLEALRELNNAGIETYSMVGPIIPMVTDSNLETLVSEIAESGTKRVMVDGLRVRPGMLEEMHKSEVFKDTDFRWGFDRAISSESYFEKAKLRIRKLCRDAGLAYECAF